MSMNPRASCELFVRFSDCDPLGHLYNVRYLDYLFDGRDQHVAENYPLLRDELWWDIARTATEEQSWDLSGITDTMAEQLSAPRFTLDSRGRVKVEPKATTRAQLGRSPDHADALLLAFHQPRAASAARTYDD